MKTKNLFLMLGAVLLTSFAFAQKVQAGKVPAAVKNTFSKQYPQVSGVSWELEHGNYEAEFRVNGTKHSVVINTAGDVLEKEEDISVSALPAAAQEYVTKNFPGQKIKEAAKITDAKGVVTFEAEVKDKDLIFDSKGNFLHKD